MAGHESKYAGCSDVALVITCEHGGNRIPAPYRQNFAIDPALLDSHRGYDQGARLMARTLAKAFAAPLLSSTVSRLLVDLNRSIGHPRLHAEVVRKAPPEVREDILEAHYRPYRRRAEALVRQAIGERGRVLHIASHSFVPVLDGKRRRADIGLLYDPSRSGEVEICGRWKAGLKSLAPGLAVRRNYPYAGKGDGLTAWFRSQFPAAVYVGIELEINQARVLGPERHWRELRQLIVESLHSVLCGPR